MPCEDFGAFVFIIEYLFCYSDDSLLLAALQVGKSLLMGK